MTECCCSVTGTGEECDGHPLRRQRQRAHLGTCESDLLVRGWHVGRGIARRGRVVLLVVVVLRSWLEAAHGPLCMIHLMKKVDNDDGNGVSISIIIIINTTVWMKQ